MITAPMKSVQGGTDLARHVTQPGGTGFGLRTGLGDEELAFVALMDLGKDVAEGAVKRMT